MFRCVEQEDGSTLILEKSSGKKLCIIPSQKPKISTSKSHQNDEQPKQPSSAVTSQVNDQPDHVSHIPPHISKSSATVSSSSFSKEGSPINGEFGSRKLRPRNDKTDYNEDKKFHILMNPKLEVISNNCSVNDDNRIQSQPRQATSREDKKTDHFVVVYKGHCLMDKSSSSNEASRLQQLLTKETPVKEDISKEISEHDTDCIDEETYFRYLNLVSKSTREKKSDDYFKTTWPLRLIARSNPYKKVQFVQQLQPHSQQHHQQQQSKSIPHVFTRISNPKCEMKESIPSLASTVTTRPASSSASLSSTQSKVQSSSLHTASSLFLESEARFGRQFLAKQNWKNQVRAFNQNLDHALIENSSVKHPLNNSLIIFTTKDTEFKNGSQVYFHRYSQFHPSSSSRSPIKASYYQVENLTRQNFLNQQSLKFSNQYISKVDLSSPLGRRLLSNVPNHLRLTPSRSDLIPIYEKYCSTSNKSVLHSLINNMPHSSVISNPIKSRITRSNNLINGAVCVSWGPRNYTHIYTFSKEQRLERAATLETGLDWKGRILSYCCKPSCVRLNALTHCPYCECYIGKSKKHQCGEDKLAPVDNTSDDRPSEQNMIVDNQYNDNNSEGITLHPLSVSKNMMNKKLSSHETLTSSNSSKPLFNILYNNSQAGVNKMSTKSEMFKCSSVCLQCEHNYCNGSDCPFDVQLEETIKKSPLRGSVAKKSTSKPSSIRLKRKETDPHILLINDETQINHDSTKKEQPCLKRHCSSPSRVLCQRASSENVSIQQIDFLTHTLSSKSNSKSNQESSKSKCSLNAIDEDDEDDDVVIIEEIINQRFPSNIVSFPKNLTITPLTRPGMSSKIRVSASRNLISLTPKPEMVITNVTPKV